LHTGVALATVKICSLAGKPSMPTAEQSTLAHNKHSPRVVPEQNQLSEAVPRFTHGTVSALKESNHGKEPVG